MKEGLRRFPVDRAYVNAINGHRRQITMNRVRYTSCTEAQNIGIINSQFSDCNTEYIGSIGPD